MRSIVAPLLLFVSVCSVHAQMEVVQTFLAAEAQREASPEAALRGYRTVVAESLREPRGNALAAPALWRWLELARMDADVTDAVAAATHVLAMPAVRGSFRPRLLASLPQLREDLLHRAILRGSEYRRYDDATALYPLHLALDGSRDLGATGEAIEQRILSQGTLSRGEMLLLRANAMAAAGRRQVARSQLREALDRHGDPAEVRAALRLAELSSGGERRRMLARVITSASDPRLVEEALYRRARLFSRVGGDEPSPFEREMLRLVERFPRGRFADDALYDIARDLQDQERSERALAAYARLRELPVNEDYADSARLRPAMMHYTRGELREARALLEELLRVRPGGPFEPEALFWLGRIAREEGDEATARAHWTRLAELVPCDYFGLRARMYVADASQPSTPPRMWLPAGAAKELRARYGAEPAPTIPPSSVYHRRVAGALSGGIYARARANEARMHEVGGGARVQEMPLSRLDDSGFFGGLCVLLALRQDAFAAAELDPRPESVLALALAIERGVQDWSVALELCGHGVPLSLTRRSQLQGHRYYLAAAMSPAYLDEARREARQWSLFPELFYAVARQESRFDPRAISVVDARGLFQFMPSVFRVLDSRHDLLTGSERAEEFLYDADSSFDLAGIWFGRELFPVFARNTYLTATFPHYDSARREEWLPFFELFAVMEHHAGRASMQRWLEEWRGLGRSEDIDLIITTIRYGSTRIFAEGVAADMILSRAGLRFAAMGAP